MNNISQIYLESDQLNDTKINAAPKALSKILASVSAEGASFQANYKQPLKPDENNWQDILSSHKINHNEKYLAPSIVLEILDNSGNYIELCGLGDFTVSIGKAKSRKTFWTNFLIASALKSDTQTDKIRSTFPKNKNLVVVFDTEQSMYHVSKVSKRVLKLAELTGYDNYEVFSLRPFTPDERVLLIEKYIYSNDNIGLLIIDGIRDLISDINNADQATVITSKLMKWTQERQIHIHVVIHQNKGDNNARGHLGTELINKAESVISVEKDKELSIVKPEYMRGQDFEPFAFSVNSDGIPYILDDWAPGGNSKSSKSKLTAYEVDRSIHLKVLTQLFKDKQPKKYKELESDLKVIFQSFDVRLSNVQTVEFISYYKINNMVQDTGGKGRSGNQYSLHESITL